jgi:hypothetical protein
MRGLAALLQLGLGALFGAALLGSGAADFDAMVRMFLFEEAHMFGLAFVTTAVAAVGTYLLSRSRLGEGLRGVTRPIQRGSITGGIVFGIGWAVSGSCPGTVLVQIGSGRWIAFATLVGLILGNLVYERILVGRFGLERRSCS